MNGNVVNNQIKLHIDDGCLGGGQEINLGWSCLGLTWSNTICDKFFKKTNPQRKNIFTYCALAEDVATIPDVMDISDYQYGFALRTDNEYFQADFEKCIAMYNPSSKDADNDEHTYLGEIFYGTDPTKTDTDGEGIPDHRDREPLKMNRRLAFIFTVVKYNWPLDPLSAKEGLYLANKLADNGFDYIYLATDEDMDENDDNYNIDFPCGGRVIFYEKNSYDFNFFNGIDDFEEYVDNKPSSYTGDDIVIMYLSGHGGSLFGKWELSLGGAGFWCLREGKIAQGISDIGTVDFLWISSCNSKDTFDEFSDSDDLFVIGCGDGGGGEGAIMDFLGVNSNDYGLLNGWNLKDSFLKLDDENPLWAHENHLEYDLPLF